MREHSFHEVQIDHQDAEIDKTEEDGWTALMFACQDGHSEVCIAFACYPGPHLFYVNLYSVHACSPCMSVTLLPNHEQVALDLLKAGVELEKQILDGATALILACQNGHVQVSQALLEAGKPHEVLPLTGVTHMTPQETVAENLLRIQLSFIQRSLGIRTEGNE